MRARYLLAMDCRCRSLFALRTYQGRWCARVFCVYRGAPCAGVVFVVFADLPRRAGTELVELEAGVRAASTAVARMCVRFCSRRQRSYVSGGRCVCGCVWVCGCQSLFLRGLSSSSSSSLCVTSFVFISHVYARCCCCCRLCCVRRRETESINKKQKTKKGVFLIIVTPFVCALSSFLPPCTVSLAGAWECAYCTPPPG